MTAERPPIHSLTVLRFLAAGHVLVGHAFPTLASSGPSRTFVRFSFSAIAMFFVLSGFILMYRYFHEERPFPWRGYFVGRVARVYPGYLFALLLTLPLFLERCHAYSKGETALISVATLTLTQNWIGFQALRWNPVGWSLSLEAAFYLVFPVLAVFVARRARLAVPLLLLGVAGALIPGLWLQRQIDSQAFQGWDRVGPWLYAAQWNPLARMPEFLLGVVLGYWFCKGKRVPWPQPVAALCLAAAAVLSLSFDAWAHRGIVLPIAAPLYGLMIFSLACAEEQASALTRWVGHPRLRLLGEASYALYLTHTAVLAYFFGTAKRLRMPGPENPGMVLLYAALAIGIAVLLYRWIETPSRRWIRQKWLSQAR